MGELNIYGIYVPMLLVLAVLTYVVLRIVMFLIEKWVAQDWIPMPSLFYLCLYVILLGCGHWLYVASY